MAQKQRIFCILLIFACLLPGCSREPPQQAYPSHTVVEIRVCCHKDSKTSTCRYVQWNKMEQILTCLRLMDPKSLPEEIPIDPSGPSSEITLLLADGSQRIYRQSSIYLQQESKAWQTVDEEQAARLDMLLRSIPRDL